MTPIDSLAGSPAVMMNVISSHMNVSFDLSVLEKHYILL